MARIIFEKNTITVRSDRYQNAPKLGRKGSNYRTNVSTRK